MNVLHIPAIATMVAVVFVVKLAARNLRALLVAEMHRVNPVAKLVKGAPLMANNVMTGVPAAFEPEC